MGTQLPFTLSLVKATYIPKQTNDSLNVFFVLNGSIELEVSNRVQTLFADDLYVVNPMESYQISSKEKNLYLYLRISKKQLEQQFLGPCLPLYDSLLLTNAEKQEEVGKLRKLLTHLMAAYFKKENRLEIEVYQYLFSFLTRMTKEFKKESPILLTMNTNEIDPRISQILETIQSEYEQALTLDDFAEKHGISYHYLSRLFKEHVGMTYTEYLNQTRLLHAAEELLLTDLPIIKVALNNGFSSGKNFHQLFKKHYQVTPSSYRKEHSLISDYSLGTSRMADFEEVSRPLALQELSKYLVEKELEDENVAVDESLCLNVKTMSYKERVTGKKIIKIGPAFEGLDSAVQAELRIVQEELCFDYILFEGFCPETNFEKEMHMISEYLLNNRLFDFFVRIHLTPMIQLCLDEQLETTDQVKNWCDRQLQLIRHFINRYGYSEVGKWYFQWKLPRNIEQKKVVNHYGYTYFFKQAKILLPEIHVGILAMQTLSEDEFEEYQLFLSEQEQMCALPDFINFHADPYRSSEIRAEHAIHFKEYQQAILCRITTTVEQIQQQPLHSTWQPEVFLTDWNTLVGEGNTLAGTFFRSALILESIIELSEKVSGIAYWLNIKVKERKTLRREDSSLSVFLYGELRRPLFFSLKFLNHLKRRQLAQGEGYLLTNEQDSYQLLVYNSSYLDPDYSVDTVQVKYQTKKLKIALTHLPKGNYLVRHYVLDKDHGGIYNDWIRVGGEQEIDSELQSYLEKKIVPKFELTKEKISKDTYHFETTLTLNACQLYLFQPIY